MRPPVPPFDEASARAKVQAAEDAWNTRDPERVAAAYTPDTPPMRTPRPPLPRSRQCAPTWGAIRPATSDIGASSGRDRSGSCTVSYATAVVPALSSASVHSRDAARWR